MNNDHILGLTQTADVGDLIPADVYSSRVLEALYAKRVFAGIISAVQEDLTAEAGSIVQVPYINPRVAQGPIAEGACLTPTDTTTGTYPIAIAKYGDYDLVNNEVFEDQNIFSMEDFATNLGKGLALKVDQLVYAALAGATPGSSETLAVAGNLSDFYDQVVELKAKMKKLNMDPDQLIVSPDAEAALLKDTTNMSIRTENITVRGGGLFQVAGLPVIVTPLANGNAVTAGLVQAIMIDSSRAVGEAWGRRPESIIDRISKAECDQTKIISWLRYGVAVLDPNAVGHIKNP